MSLQARQSKAPRPHIASVSEDGKLGENQELHIFSRSGFTEKSSTRLRGDQQEAPSRVIGVSFLSELRQTS